MVADGDAEDDAPGVGLMRVVVFVAPTFEPDLMVPLLILLPELLFALTPEVRFAPVRGVVAVLFPAGLILLTDGFSAETWPLVAAETRPDTVGVEVVVLPWRSAVDFRPALVAPVAAFTRAEPEAGPPVGLLTVPSLPPRPRRWP